MSNGEPVRWNVSTDRATRASWSPTTESTCASHNTRNSGTANTAPKVAGTGSNRSTTAAAVPIAVIPVGFPGTVDQAAAMATWLRPAALAR